MNKRSLYLALVILINWYVSGYTVMAQELYRVKQLPCSTPAKNEFCAVPYNGGIIYCSDNPDYSPLKFETTKGSKPLINMAFAVNDSAGKSSGSTAFNSVYAHDGPVVFYAHETKAILTRTLSEKTKLKSVYKDTRLGLFFFEKKNGKWVEVAPFPFNNYTYSCGQAAINEQGNVLIFSSDMPGGNGGTDLYYSTFIEADSGWTIPVNLGPVVNSSKNEMFPFLHASGILYFSSNGKKGKGGLDVFHTAGGYPYKRIVHENDDVNSTGDDFGFWASPDFSRGYISSDRNGTDDIFSVTLSYPQFTDCKDYEKVSYCYQFFEEASIDVDTIPMVYEWDFGDGIKKKGLSAYHCYSEPGYYNVQLNVYDTVVNALFMNEANYDLEIPDLNQPIMEVPDSANPNVAFEVSAGQSRFRDFPIAEYYWDFGDGRQLKGERVTVTLTDKGVYDVILGVAGKPDNNGHAVMRCFKKKIIVTDVEIEPRLVDDTRDPAYNKLPGGTSGLTYLVVENENGLQVTRMKSDGTENSTLNSLPPTIYYLQVKQNGDTVVRSKGLADDSKKLLQEFLDKAYSPTENKKNGIISYTAFLPHDSVQYPIYKSDIDAFYAPIDSLIRSITDYTRLPNDLSGSLYGNNAGESNLEVYNNTRRKKTYNTTATNDSTTVFYRQVSEDSTQANPNNTTQFATTEYKDHNTNDSTNNVAIINKNKQQNNNTQNTEQNNTTQNTEQNNTTQNTEQNNTTQNTEQNNTTQNTEQNNTTQQTEQNNTTQNTEQNHTTQQTEQNNTTQNTEQNNTTQQTEQNNTTQNQTSDTAELSVAEMLSFAHPDLQFRVQIGAYRYPWNFKYEKLRKLGKGDEKEKLEDGITRFTLGRFNTLGEAYNFRDTVKREGIDDAFVTAIYKGKRYYLSELKAILKPLIRPG